MRFAPIAFFLVIACNHSEPFATAAIAPEGPFGNGTDVLLTLNPGANYWPTWTEDGKGILYQYSQPGTDGSGCLGLLPAAGGTMIWSLCDNRFRQIDSSISFASYALGSDGRLLYLEAISRLGVPEPLSTILWLADTANPFSRRALLSLPMSVGGTRVDWLADAAWTGPATFTALADSVSFITVPGLAGGTGTFTDTVFIGEFVVSGAASSQGATLQAFPATAGAANYALAESGASVVFATNGSLIVERLRLTDDTATAVATIPRAAGTIVGLSCRATECLVTTSTAVASTLGQPNLATGGQIWLVDLAAGTVRSLLAAAPASQAPWFTARIAPNSNDALVQVGGCCGFLALNKNNAGSALHLFKGLVP